MEKRAFIAVGLSIAVFYISSMLFDVDKKPAGIDSPQEKASVAAPQEAVKPSQPAVQQSSPVPAPQSSSSLIPSKEIKIETDLYSAVFSSRGAALKSLTLKNYREANSPTAKQVVIGADSDPNVPSFTTRTAGIAFPESAVFSVDAESLKLTGSEAKQLVFNYVSGQGFTLRKTYTFSADTYSIKLETSIFNNSPAPMTGAVQHVLTYPAQLNEKDSRYEGAGAYLFSEKSLYTDKFKDVAAASKRYDKSIHWAGFADKYFLNSILSEKNSIALVELKKNGAGFFEASVASPQVTVNPGQSTTVTHRLFVGPKDIDILKAQGNQLEESLDLGWFTVIANPLLYSLKFFYAYVGNYGTAIIIITVILKILFFPLTHKSYKSMKGMQKIQPEMNKLREKFKDDRDAMNRAVMELYREHKVNPMGGCLPMIVQIPVFFALYKSLMSSIELRHAPFYLWITDLADKDPYYVTPIIMGVTMFIQQKMTPSNMEPLQQKIMLALPVVFTFMFLNFPSGLVLYWLVNNVLTIGQQMYINKLVKD